MSGNRIRTLIARDLRDLSQHLTTLLPVALITLLSLVIPFGLAVGIPWFTARPLSHDSELVQLSAVVGATELPPEARVQVFLLQQFLMLFLIIPITGAMTLAAHAVIGEKQARTLEPLLATPVTTAELLIAKVAGALLPTLAISLAGLAIYLGGVFLLAAPGVAHAMVNLRTAILILVVGPAAALVALQCTIVVSSRVNDARTAQQFGVLIIVPLAIVLIAQFTGALWLSASQLALAGVGLLGAWVLLVALSVGVFDRESILTRWH